ncbi:hypothetical protein M405DRAFT_867717 [Rhizopogon salebrosus TDB-379]|nr:hypothetical protein M405DRAFT_867717 [Rhizopogon salebrosus TDB-379]
MAPTTRGRASDSVPTLQVQAKQAKSTPKNAVAKRKRLLEKEEKAEAARQELEWRSRLNQDELDEIFDDPDAEEDGEDGDEDLDDVPRMARKWLQATTLNEDDDDFNESDAAFNAELEALRSRQAKKLKSSTRNTCGSSFEASSPVLLFVGVIASGSSDSHPKHPTSFTMFGVTLEASNARPDPHNKSGCEDR